MSPSHKTLAESAKETIAKNPTALGDPISLKAEKSDTQPTPADKPNKSSSASSSSSSTKGKKETPAEEAERKRTGGTSEGKMTLAEAAMSNPTMLGDPISLKAERSRSKVTEQDKGAKGVDKVESKL